MKDRNVGSARNSLGKAIKRISAAQNQRGHATWFHASNEFQSAMEVAFAAEWAQVMNHRHGWAVRNVRKNSDVYPDCLADFVSDEANETATIGIELTELVDQDAIDAHQEERRLAKQGRLGDLSDAERKSLLVRKWPVWPFEKFSERLTERIEEKDRRSRVGSLKMQFLLIVTAEDLLDEHTLRQYVEKLSLPKPRNFDAVYLMGEYVPDPGKEGHYPVFELRFLE